MYVLYVFFMFLYVFFMLVPCIYYEKQVWIESTKRNSICRILRRGRLFFFMWNAEEILKIIEFTFILLDILKGIKNLSSVCHKKPQFSSLNLLNDLKMCGINSSTFAYMEYKYYVYQVYQVLLKKKDEPFKESFKSINHNKIPGSHRENNSMEFKGKRFRIHSQIKVNFHNCRPGDVVWHFITFLSSFRKDIDGNVILYNTKTE